MSQRPNRSSSNSGNTIRGNGTMAEPATSFNNKPSAELSWKDVRGLQKHNHNNSPAPLDLDDSFSITATTTKPSFSSETDETCSVTVASSSVASTASSVSVVSSSFVQDPNDSLSSLTISDLAGSNNAPAPQQQPASLLGEDEGNEEEEEDYDEDEEYGSDHNQRDSNNVPYAYGYQVVQRNEHNENNNDNSYNNNDNENSYNYNQNDSFNSSSDDVSVAGVTVASYNSIKTHNDSISSLPSNAKHGLYVSPQNMHKGKRRGKRRNHNHSNRVVSQDTEDEYEDDEASHMPSSAYPRETLVQFDEDSNVYIENYETWEEYDVPGRWFSSEEYKKFKSQVIQMVKAVLKAQMRRQRHEGSDHFSYSAIIEHTYGACFDMELEIGGTLNILTKQELSQLKRLYRTSLDIECTLGLERLLVQRIGQDRSELRASLFSIVQDLQDSSHDWPNEHVLQDNIFQISQEVSRPARLFARQLALAQSLCSTSSSSSSSSHHSKKSKSKAAAPAAAAPPPPSDQQRRNSH